MAASPRPKGRSNGVTMAKVRIVIELETDMTPEQAVKEFMECFDYWPGSGYYSEPWENAEVKGETGE